MENLQQNNENLNFEISNYKSKFEDMFFSEWSEFIDSLVSGDLMNHLNNYGILINTTSQKNRQIYKDKHYEFDLLAKNLKDIVVVEVKTTLKVKHVKSFIDNLKKFKKVMPEYANKNVYGAIAYLQADERSQTYALNQKLFVIRATGNSSSIVNDKDFIPKSW